MPLTDAAVDSLLDLLFNNSNWANVGDATGLRGSSASGQFYLSLHNASPGTSGNQTTNETAYTSYARVGVVRTSSGFVRTGTVYNPAATISWPTCTGGSDTITHVGFGSDATGSGHLFGFMACSPSIVVSNTVTPQATTASTFTFT